MRYDRAYFDAGVDRRNTECEKWDDRDVLDEDAIPLWVADMDFPCPQAITDAILERASHPCYGYNMAVDADEAAIRGFWKRRHGLDIQPGQTQMLPCVITGLKTCVRAFTQAGDSVAMFTPVYGPFFGAVTSNQRKVASVPLIREEGTGRFLMNFQGLEEALRKGARLIMLCNPHNPVSRMWTREELTAVCLLAEKYDAKIVCDEIHADFAYPGHPFTPLLSIPEAKDRAVTLCSASKTFNVAGLQQAAAISFRPDFLQAMRQGMEAAGVRFGNTFALCAARAAYTKCDDWLDGLLEYLDGSREELKRLTAAWAPKAVLSPIEATYLAWLDVRPYGKTCEQMAEMCRRHKVAFVAGTVFGPEGEGFIRINFACPREMLREGIRRLGDALKEE